MDELAIKLVVFSGQERHVVSLNEYSFSLHGEHSIPFPAYPGLHLHSKLPIVFVQIAFISQSLVPNEHSSISMKFFFSGLSSKLN